MDPVTQFSSAIINAIAGFIVAGAISICGLLVIVALQFRSLTKSVQAVYQALPPILRAMRYLNSALREAGANGSTTKADACLDEADKALDRRLEERVGGAA